MQIRDSSFFSQLLCWAGPGSATPTLEELGEFFADPAFDEQRDVMHPLGGLGDEPLDVASLPAFELPDTVLFPDQSVTLTVSRADPLLRLVEQGGAAVRLGDEPPAPLVKFRARSSQPREDDNVPGAVCTLGTVRVNARYGPGEASLHLLAYARVNDQGKHDLPGRNPMYPVFCACADFPELRENFVKLIRQSPGLDAVPEATCWTRWRPSSRSDVSTTHSSRTNREAGTRAGTKHRSDPYCFSTWRPTSSRSA